MTHEHDTREQYFDPESYARERCLPKSMRQLLAIAHDPVALHQLDCIERYVLSSQPPMTRLDDYPVHLAANTLRIASSPDEAVELWRSFQEQLAADAQTGRGLTPRERAIFDVDTDTIHNYFAHVPESMTLGRDDARQALKRRAVAAQQEKHPLGPDRRSLNGLATHGMEYALAIPEGYQPASDDRPAFLDMRYQRIATINGHTGSYVNHAIHDGVDHWFALQTIMNSGIANEFHDLFGRLGNPQNSNIFNLEGEALASQIVYNWRNTHNDVRRTHRNISLDELRAVFARQCREGILTENQADAYMIIANLDEWTDEARQLEMIYPSTIVELIALQKKHGSLSYYDSEGNKTGNFSLSDPEYLAFVIMINRLLMEKRADFTNALLNTNLHVEHALRHPSSEPTLLTLDDITRPAAETINNLNIPPGVVRWFGDHPFRTGLNEDRSITIPGFHWPRKAGSFAVKVVH